MEFEFNLECYFHKRQVSFLVVKTAKCKRGITPTQENLPRFKQKICSLKKRKKVLDLFKVFDNGGE